MKISIKKKPRTRRRNFQQAEDEHCQNKACFSHSSKRHVQMAIRFQNNRFNRTMQKLLVISFCHTNVRVHLHRKAKQKLQDSNQSKTQRSTNPARVYATRKRRTANCRKNTQFALNIPYCFSIPAFYARFTQSYAIKDNFTLVHPFGAPKRLNVTTTQKMTTNNLMFYKITK